MKDYSVLHIASSDLGERFYKMLIPLSEQRSSVKHQILYLSKVQPLVESKGVTWIEAGKWMDTRTIQEISRLIDERKPAVVHVHGVELLPTVFAANTKHKFKRVVSTFRPMSSNWIRKSLETILGQSTRWVDLVCFNSYHLEESYIASGFPAKKAHVQFDGVKIPKISKKTEFWAWAAKYSKVLDANNFFLVMPQTVRTGFSAWLKGWEKMSDEQKPMVFMDASDYAVIKSKVKGIKYIRTLPSEFLYVAAQETTAAIVADDRYILSLVAPEFAHLGTPFIGPSVSGIAEIVIDNYNGRLCHPKRVEEWTQAYFELTNDFAFREKLKKSSRAVATSELSILRWRERLERMYEPLFGS